MGNEQDPQLRAKPPLEGRLYMAPDADSFISPDDIANIIGFLRHDGSFDGEVFHAQGRNATIPVADPKTIYDAIQISGGAFIPMGVSSNTATAHGIVAFSSEDREIMPPAQGNEQYTHRYQAIEGGKLVKKEDQSPMGSYAQWLAEYKFDMTADAAKIDSDILLLPQPLGKYEFHGLPDGQGGNATALVFGVPFSGARTDSAIISWFFDHVSKNPNDLNAALNQYMPPLMQTMSMIGRAASDIHRSGIIHNQLTLGNVLAIESRDEKPDRLYVADWETARAVDPADKELSEMLDLLVSYRSFSNTIDKLHADTDIGDEHATAILREAFIVLMAGYHNLPLEISAQYLRQNEEVWVDAFRAAYAGKSDVDDLLKISKLSKGLGRVSRLLNREI